MFVQKITGEIIAEPPLFKKYKKSQCTPLFMNAYLMKNAGAVIHTHSKDAVMITLLYKNEFRISNQEMIKGIKKCTTCKYKSYFLVIITIVLYVEPQSI